MIKYYLIFISLFTFNNSFSQANDLELWTGISIKKKIVKNLNSSFDLQSRFNQNASNNSNNFGQFNLSYDIAKTLAISTSYRLAFKNNSTNYLTQNRLCFNFSYNQKIKPLNLRFKLRARYQFGFNRLKVINESIFPDYSNTIRIKSTLEYKINSLKKIRPAIGAEIFFNQFNSPFTDDIPSRIFGTVEWNIKKRQSIKFKYIYESTQNNFNDVNHIYAVTYTYQLKGKLF